MVRVRTTGNNLYEGQTYFFYRKFAYKTKTILSQYIFTYTRFRGWIRSVEKEMHFHLRKQCTLHVYHWTCKKKKTEIRQFFVKSFYDKSFMCFFLSYHFLTALKICYDLERLRWITSRGNQNVRYSLIFNFILPSLN